MYCFFISCWRQGRFPICSIGPSWAFTCGLLVFSFMVLAFMIAMICMLEDKGEWMRKAAGSCIAINLFLLFGGILGDPGVKPATYLHYTKNWFSGGKDLYKSDSDDESSES